MTNESSERRCDYRQESSERLFVQIVSCDVPDLVGTTVSCHAIDVSPNGLQIASEAEIPTGSRLDIWVDIASRPGKFFLTSDVRWSKKMPDGLCNLGVQLHDGAATDIEDWRTANA